MPIGWLSVLKAVPWTEVITNAPKVAEGAKKLWSSVGKKVPQPAAGAAPSATPDADTLTDVQTRLVAVEAAARDLHDQMLASSEVIKALAEQNAQLIRGVEAIRIRARWLIGAVLASLAAALATLAWSLSR